MKFFTLFFLFFVLICPSLFAESRLWDPPKKVDEHTIFFGENQRPTLSSASSNERPEPSPGDKSYPWVLLEKGNNFLLAGHFEKAAAAFAKSYEISGPTRVLSGFKLIEADEKLGRWDEAIAVLEEMKNKYLASTKEFGEATRLRSELEDNKRKNKPESKPAKRVGREWLFKLSPERMKYVLQGMEVLRAHGVPLKEPAQKYAFRLDEYFIAHPEASADDPAKALATVIYEKDMESRIPIDRWRLSIGSVLPTTPESQLPTSNLQLRNPFTGAEWIRLTQNEKMDYVLNAMAVLKNQNVPMKKSAYAYVFSVDRFFTDKPELPASDSVLTLASILYNTEPEAHEVLEAIRLTL